MNNCIAAIPSINICIKGQKALTENGIFSKIVNLEPSLTKRGCAYGIEFNCSEKSKVKSILQHYGIKVSQYVSGDGTNLV
jgi:hypothetical protein